ncbi:hypothetical protein G6F59_015016 [Rhizopus arrhizus]|nr:hypothetical protein G6F59_015016 [Rhizopus arrhizus]
MASASGGRAASMLAAAKSLRGRAAGQHDGEQQVVPAHQERDDEGRGDARQRHGQRHVAQHLPARAAVHARGALDFHGQRCEVAHQHPRQQWDHRGQVHDPQAEQAARQPDGGEEHVVRDQQRNGRQGARGQQHPASVAMAVPTAAAGSATSALFTKPVMMALVCPPKIESDVDRPSTRR